MSQFDSSTFTAADGTELSASDANWTKLDAAADNAVITGNRLRRVIPSGSATARYRRTTAAPSADYSVACDLYVVGTTSTAYNGGPMARCVAGELTGYWARWRNGTGIQLFRYNTGTATQLGSTVTQSQSAGSTLRLTLRCEGNVISVYRNAETTPIISVIDGSPITAAGYPGILTATDSTTDGPHLDNWSSDTIEPAGGTLDAEADGAAIASGTASTSFDGPTVVDAAASGAAVASGTANATASTPTIVSEPLYDNVPNLLANEPLTYVAVYHPTTGALVVRKTGLSTGADGRYTFTDPALSTGIDYLHDWLTASGHRRMPVKAAS